MSIDKALPIGGLELIARLISGRLFHRLVRLTRVFSKCAMLDPGPALLNWLYSLPGTELLSIVDSMAQLELAAVVQIAAGDSKVVKRGKGDGLFINTAGLEVRPANRDFGCPASAPGRS